MKANSRPQGHPFFHFLAMLTLLLAFAIAGSFLPGSISSYSVNAQQEAVTLVNAASFASDNILSPDALGSAFGTFTTLNGGSYNASEYPVANYSRRGERCDQRAAGWSPLRWTASDQSGGSFWTSLMGTATIVVTDQSTTTKSGTFTVVRSRPGIFTANPSSPLSAPAADVTSDGINYQFVSNPDGTPREISAGTPQQPSYLVLYLTALRHTPAANPGDGNGVAESVMHYFPGCSRHSRICGHRSRLCRS